MRVVVCHKYFFINSGPERYMFTINKEIEKNGHTVIPFSVLSTKNEATPYSKYFISPPGGDPDSYGSFKAMKLNPISSIKVAARAVYSTEAKRKFEQLIQNEKPDIVYILNIFSYISPSILDVCRKYQIPAIMYLPSYDLQCVANTFLRDGKPCTLCKTGSHIHALKYKCNQGSMPATIAKVIALYTHNMLNIYRDVYTFVTPSSFMRKQMIEGGFPEAKVKHIPIYADTTKYIPSDNRGSNILYFGRISKEKGVHVLLEAYKLLRNKIPQEACPPLHIVGSGDTAYIEDLKQEYQRIEGISFPGFMEADEMAEEIQNSLFMVHPAIWFDNTPIAVYESFACAKPVIASDIGSLPEQVITERRGLLFEPNNSQALMEAMLRFINNPDEVKKFGTQAYEDLQNYYGVEKHYQSLMELFNGALKLTRQQVLVS